MVDTVIPTPASSLEYVELVDVEDEVATGFSGLTTRIDSRNGVASITLSGELDVATVPVLERHLALFESNGIGGIILDLRELTFLDYSGLHIFLAAHTRAKVSGRKLILIGATHATRRLFEVTSTEFLLDDGDAAGVLDQFTGNQGRRTARIATPDIEADV
ncbi:MAG: anti-sigma factor antagonist [Actinomycetota bacterium]|jgi:anti-sigma B factor antagonist|nr:anti-sigma factor antagonist [Actinomycetota bacterium]